mgnify:CR=1 FL=1
MARRKVDDTPSFDVEISPGVDVAVVDERAPAATQLASGRSSWREVPQALFLSWSDAMQAAYCRDRDLGSSKCAENDEWQQFYLQRANGYDDDIHFR